MKAFLFAVVAVVAIGVAASVVLEGYQSTAANSLVGGGARPDPDTKWQGNVAPKS